MISAGKCLEDETPKLISFLPLAGDKPFYPFIYG